MKSPDRKGRSERPGIRSGASPLVLRLRRIEGQVRGLSKMIVEERDCVDILTQVSAIKSALDQTALRLLETHTRGSVQKAIRNGEGEVAVARFMEVTRKFLRT